MSFDPLTLRPHFPELNDSSVGPDLTYFDNAASTLQHAQVAHCVHQFNLRRSSNVHRGAHRLSQEATEEFEKARRSVAQFLGAQKTEEVIFTKGTTEGINLVAQSYALRNLKAGDQVLISHIEHHSNIVPWQALAEQIGIQLVVVPFHKEKGFDLEDFKSLLSAKTKMVCTLWYSNALGFRLPIEGIVTEAHKVGAVVLVDGAQAPLHEKIQVQKINMDFLAFSGHKMCAPHGIGALYVHSRMYDKMKPYQFGGSMIDRVSLQGTTYAEPPQKFEAGTPNIGGAIGLGAACDWISKSNIDDWHLHMSRLRKIALEALLQKDSFSTYEVQAEELGSVLSFNHRQAHSSDIGNLLSQYHFAVRAGHHCAQPLMQAMGVPGTVRLSFAPYNTEQEVHRFTEHLSKIEEFF